MGYLTVINLRIFILFLNLTISSECIIIICITNEKFIVYNSTIVPYNNIKTIVFIYYINTHFNAI